MMNLFDNPVGCLISFAISRLLGREIAFSSGSCSKPEGYRTTTNKKAKVRQSNDTSSKTEGGPFGSMEQFLSIRRNLAPIAVVSMLIAVLMLLPVRYGQKLFPNTERVKAEILSTDESGITGAGIIKFGDQRCEVKILQGQFKGRTASAMNHLNGSLENDKIFKSGDKALAVIDYANDGAIVFVNLVDHYRLNYELVLTLIFIAALVAFAGIVGFKALLSFFFTILTVWKVLLPAFLSGHNAILLGAFITLLLTAVIIGLVYGFDKRSLAAIGGAIAGSLVTCITAIVFVRLFKIHGAVMSFSEQLLYSGYTHLNLTEIFIAGIFIASSGAVMDLAVDITSAVHEIVEKRPDISKWEAVKSGLSIGRSVMGTMTTTLLLAYSGGYIALLLVFMAQGTPIINILNLKYVAAEILHTIVGSFGLVTVAPLTALVSGTLLARSEVRTRKGETDEEADTEEKEYCLYFEETDSA